MWWKTTRATSSRANSKRKWKHCIPAATTTSVLYSMEATKSTPKVDSRYASIRKNKSLHLLLTLFMRTGTDMCARIDGCVPLTVTMDMHQITGNSKHKITPCASSKMGQGTWRLVGRRNAVSTCLSVAIRWPRIAKVGLLLNTTISTSAIVE